MGHANAHTSVTNDAVMIMPLSNDAGTATDTALCLAVVVVDARIAHTQPVSVYTFHSVA